MPIFNIWTDGPRCYFCWWFCRTSKADTRCWLHELWQHSLGPSGGLSVHDHGRQGKNPFQLAALRWESGHEMERGHWNNGTLQKKIPSSTFIDVQNGAKLPGWTDIMYRVQDSYDFIAWKTCGDGGMVWIGGIHWPIFFGNSLSFFGMRYAMSILWNKRTLIMITV